MRKTIKYAALVAAIATVLTGCKKDGESYSSVHLRTYSYVTDGVGDPIISESSFNFNFNFTTDNSSVVSSEFDLADGKDSFSIPSVPFDMAGGNYFTGKISDGGKTKNGEAITNFTYTVAPMYLPPRESWNLSYNVDPESGLPTPDLRLNVNELGICMNATMGGTTRLRTFWNDVTFVGKTNTSVNGNAATAFENADICYRVKMDLKRKKADVIMYDVQFNPHMPSMTVLILPDLDLVFTNQGYIVEGKDVIPLYINGNTLVEKPDYPFSSFILNSTGDLMGASANFTVTPTGFNFIGSFRGDCMVRL